MGDPWLVRLTRRKSRPPTRSGRSTGRCESQIEPEWLERERVRPIHKCSRRWAAGKAQRRLSPLARVWREATYIVAAILALLSLLLLPSATGVAVAWIFSLWGSVDLLNAFYQANQAGLLAGQWE